VHYV
jgi:molybdenum-dependent DNA-binding transcriptional regulator ModE